jgi:predicted negative regulator of RcsB-dependent stress response
MPNTDPAPEAGARRPETQPEVSPADDLQQLRELWRNYGLTLVVAAGVVIVGVTGLLLYRAHSRRSLEEASRRLSSARTAQDLQALVAGQPSSPVAPLAMLKLAQSYFEARNYDLARKEYEDFQARFRDHSLLPAAELGRIHCLEAQGQIEDALEGFTRFAADHPTHFLTAQAVLGRGRCLEAQGRLVEARVVYEDFIASQPKSSWLPRVQETLDSVNRELSRSRPAAEPATDEPAA